MGRQLSLGKTPTLLDLAGIPKQEQPQYDGQSLVARMELLDPQIQPRRFAALHFDQGAPGGPFSEVITDVQAPADIGWDSKRKLVLIPHFNDDTVEVRPLPALELR